MYRGIQAAARGSALRRGPQRTVRPQDSMDLEFAQLSDVGRVREGNEDYLGHVDPGTPEEARARGWLFAVADGVGGHDLGEVASHTAVESMLAGFREATPGEAAHRAVDAPGARRQHARGERRARGRACRRLHMATTLVACALRYDRATVAHVGDSRCYLIRRGQAALLTRDHTVANEQVRLGSLSAEEAARPKRAICSAARWEAN